MKTRAYGERARAVVEMNFICKDCWHPWQTIDVDLEFDIRIYDPSGTHLSLLEDEPHFRKLRDLLLSWEFAPKNCTELERNRRIIVIKDMHPRVLELLGVLLDIPPEFFLVHCQMAPTLSVIGEDCATDRGSTYWKVLVPRSYHIPDEVLDAVRSGAEYDIKLGNLHRGVAVKPYRSVAASSFVSYWARSYGTDSWIGGCLRYRLIITRERHF